MTDQRLSTVDQLRDALMAARDLAKSSRLDLASYSPQERNWFGLIEDEVNYALHAVNKLDLIQGTLF